MPRTWEHTVGAERDLGKGVRLGADLVYRRTTDLPNDAQPRRLYNDPRLYQRYWGGTAALQKRAGARWVDPVV
jgi:hypothetical protein